MCVAAELTSLLRTVINDWDSPQRYSDTRLNQVIISAARMVIADSGNTDYSASLTTMDITPDPASNVFLSNLIILKANCIIDTFSARDAARRSGISFSEFSSKVDFKGNADAFLKMMQLGPCKMYDEAIFSYLYGDGSIGTIICTPFRTYYSQAYYDSSGRR